MTGFWLDQDDDTSLDGYWAEDDAEADRTWAGPAGGDPVGPPGLDEPPDTYETYERDEPDDGPDAPGVSRRRRAVLAGVTGTAVAAAWSAVRGVPWTTGTLPDGLVPQPDTRAAGFRAADAGGFGDRDESFARSVGTPAPAEPAGGGSTGLFPTAGEAAAAAEVSVPTILATDDPALHLLRRFTFGPTAALVDEVHDQGIDAWITRQLDPSAIPDETADAAWAAFPMAGMSPPEIQGAIERYSWDAMTEYGWATLARQIWSRRQLFEVMVDFWANHLNVPVPGPGSWDLGPSYHSGVIREHALGSFTDMLLAAGRHPALLRYLSNAESTKDSVNENLGRELLELHTVGVGSGYTEHDVRNSAYILTGRSVVGEDDPGEEGAFSYVPDMHWTGPVRVLDFEHANGSAEGGLDVGDAYLRYLAAHPATAHAIARKLAVRFVADDPPDELVDRLAAAYLDAETAIVPVLDVLFRSVELWSAVGRKTRRPLENVVAAARVLDVRPGGDVHGMIESLYWRIHQAGHRPLAWPAPNGYPDVHAAWRSASGLLETWNAHRGLVQGWHEGGSYVPPGELVGDRPGATVGEYIDSLCQQLCFQTFQPPHREALIGFLDADAATPTDQTDMEWMVDHLAPLVLDAPYFALR